MKFISHRGNLRGRESESENHPEYIDEAIKRGFDVEIDVWYDAGTMKLHLGHDMPQYKIDLNWIRERRKHLWCHAKNLEALNHLLHYGELNTFWHQEDDYTVTSHGMIWTYPNKRISKYSYKQVILLFDYQYGELEIPHGGICSDYIELYKEKYIFQ